MDEIGEVGDIASEWQVVGVYGTGFLVETLAGIEARVDGGTRIDIGSDG